MEFIYRAKIEWLFNYVMEYSVEIMILYGVKKGRFNNVDEIMQ